MRRFFHLAVLLGALQVASSFAVDSREFSIAAAEAADKFHTTEGHEYAVSLMRSVAPALVDAMHACNTSEFKTQSVYDLIFVVSSAGSVERLLSTPTNPFARCIAAHLHLPASVTKPPKASWPVQIRILHGRMLQGGSDPPFIIFSDDPSPPPIKT
jgi:hypothetical protein